AAAGFTGAPAITVEGADVADLWADLGTTWRIAEQYFKPWPVCRWAQPSVQAVLDLRARHGVTADQVERIEIATFHQSRRLAARDPASTEEAQYSTAYPAAVALVRGRVDPADVAEDGLADPLIRGLAAGMTVTEREDFNAAFPARRFADVRLVMKDGRVLDSGPTEAAGDPEAPAPMDAVRAKFRAYAAPVLGEVRAADLEKAVDRLGDGGGTGTLFGLLGAA
ncbi:MmgE/PrpD family protein, partial [Paracoccus sp. PXZ]